MRSAEHSTIRMGIPTAHRTRERAALSHCTPCTSFVDIDMKPGEGLQHRFKCCPLLPCEFMICTAYSWQPCNEPVHSLKPAFLSAARACISNIKPCILAHNFAAHHIFNELKCSIKGYQRAKTAPSCVHALTADLLSKLQACSKSCVSRGNLRSAYAIPRLEITLIQHAPS